MSPSGHRRALLQSPDATGDFGEDAAAELDGIHHGTVPQAVDLRHRLLPRVRRNLLSSFILFLIFFTSYF